MSRVAGPCLRHPPNHSLMHATVGFGIGINVQVLPSPFGDDGTPRLMSPPPPPPPGALVVGAQWGRGVCTVGTQGANRGCMQGPSGLRCGRIEGPPSVPRAHIW